MATNAGTLRWIIEADASKFDETVDQVEQKAKTLVKTLKQSDKTANFDKSKKSAEIASESFKTLGKSLSGIGWNAAKIGATALAGTLTSLASKGIAGADALNKYNAQIVGLANSTEDANSAMSQAVDFFKNNPFQRFETVEAVKNLMMYDKSIANADTGSAKLRKTLDMLGVASLSTGTGISELASQWGEIANASQVSVGQLDEFAHRVPAIWDAIGKRIGKRADEVRESLVGVGISGNVVREAMQDLYGLDTKKLGAGGETTREYLESLSGAARQSAEAYVAFNNTMARQDDRVKGRLADMQAAIAGYTISVDGGFKAMEGGIYQSVINLKKAFADQLASSSANGKAMAEAFNKISKAISPLIDKLASALPSIIEKVISVIDTFGDVLQKNQAILIPIIGSVLALFGGLGKDLPVIGGLLNSLSSQTKGIFGSLANLIKLNPLLSAFVGIFVVGFANAVKTDEEFRKSIGQIFTSLGTIVAKIVPLFTTLVKIFTQIATSSAVTGILKLVANALSLIASALSSIPEDILQSLVMAVLVFRMMDANPLYVWALGIATIVAAIQSFIKNAGGFNAVITKITTAFAKLPETLVTIGNNVMTGLAKGISEGAKKVGQLCKQIALTIVGTFKKALQIHSPSKVMNEIGGYVTLGLAEGITDKESVVQKAMENLAEDILSEADKVIGNKVDFGLLDVNGEYKAWKQISKLFTVGSKQYQTAMEKMEDARKKVNLKIIDLQNDYNDTLDGTIKRLSTMYGLFDQVNIGTGKNAEKILTDLSEQVSAMQGYSAALTTARGLGLEEGLLDELQAMGISAVDELQAIANMSQGQIDALNELYRQKQEVATNEAVAQTAKLKNETLDEISKLAEGIDGETVKVSESGARLVSEIGDGITGAMPTLESAFSKLGDYMNQAAKELGKGAGDSASGAIDDSIADLGDIAKQDLSDVLKDAQDSIKSFGERLIPILAGIIGGVVAFKFGSKLVASLLANQLGSMPGILGAMKIGGGAKVATEGAKQVTESLNEVSNVGKTVTTATKEITKGQQMMSTMRSALLNIALIAVDIALVAGALWAAHQLLSGIDLGQLVAELGVVGLAVAGMGGLAIIASKFDWTELAIGLALIAGVALDITLVAGSLAALNNAIKDPSKTIVNLGLMGLAIVEMGVLAGIVGALVVGTAGIGALIAGAGVAMIVALAGAFALIATELKVVEVINLNKNKVIANVNTIKDIVNEISPSGDVLGSILGAVAGFAEVYRTAEIGLITLVYRGIAENLNYIQKVKLDSDKIIAKVTLIKDIVNKLSSNGTGSVLFEIQRACLNFMDIIKTVEVSLIVDTYAKMAENLDKIQNIELNRENILAKIKQLGEVVVAISNPVTSGKGMWEAIGDCVKMMAEAKAVESSNKILDVYSGMGDKLSAIQNIKADFEGVKAKVDSLGQIMQLIIDQKGDGGIFGAIGNFFTGNPIKVEDVERIKNILEKMSEIGKVASSLTNIDAGTIGFRVGSIKGIIDVVGQIKDPGNMANKEWVVGMATSIAYKLVELQNAIALLKEQDTTGIVQTALNSLNLLLTGIVTTLNDKLASIEEVGKNLSLRLKTGIESQKDAVSKAGASLQSAMWAGIEPKMQDEFFQGQALSNQLKQGIVSVDFSETGKFAYSGFVNGVRGGWFAVYQEGRLLADRFLKGLKDRGQQGSPWKTTFQSGAWAAEGLIDGIESEEAQVIRTAERMADSIVSALDISDMTVSPEVGLNGLTAPELSGFSNGNFSSGRTPVIINQTNQNYTQYSLEQLNRDLRWELAKV